LSRKKLDLCAEKRKLLSGRLLSPLTFKNKNKIHMYLIFDKNSHISWNIEVFNHPSSFPTTQQENVCFIYANKDF
jgi:hypothetical protein